MPQLDSLVCCVLFASPTLLLQRPESWTTGQDLYQNLSKSQIQYLTTQHKNKPKKLENRDVNDFESWKTQIWNTYYRNGNFLISKWVIHGFGIQEQH